MKAEADTRPQTGGPQFPAELPADGAVPAELVELVVERIYAFYGKREIEDQLTQAWATVRAYNKEALKRARLTDTGEESELRARWQITPTQAIAASKAITQLMELRRQIWVLVARDANETLGESSPFNNDPIYRMHQDRADYDTFLEATKRWAGEANRKRQTSPARIAERSNRSDVLHREEGGAFAPQTPKPPTRTEGIRGIPGEPNPIHRFIDDIDAVANDDAESVETYTHAVQDKFNAIAGPWYESVQAWRRGLGEIPNDFPRDLYAVVKANAHRDEAIQRYLNRLDDIHNELEAARHDGQPDRIPDVYTLLSTRQGGANPATSG
jgi:hypothetical protein